MRFRAKINNYCLIKLLIIALFAVLPFNVFAANFKYSEFNWEEFSKSNANYWENYCKKDDDKCESKILKSQEKFYKKLYSILAKYESNGILIDDNIILETVFLDLSPSSFSNLDFEYSNTFDTETGAYIVDEEDDDIDEDVAEYYTTEKDTLKTLIKHMTSYQASCYGIIGNPKTVSLADGSSSLTCDKGAVTEIDGSKLCADKVKTFNLSFWETLPNNIFLGHKTKKIKKDECTNETTEYPSNKFVVSKNRTLNLDSYWDFLINTSYFDNKAHLQYRFYDKVLKPAKVSCLSDSVCKNSLQSKGLYDDYEEQLKKIREDIVEDIKSILENYGTKVNEVNINANSLSPTEMARRGYYFPIGSKELTTTGNIKYGIKDPESVKILSYYGTRKNEDGEEEQHNGIDIKGTNAISIYSGEVVTVMDKCKGKDKDTCNDGYGKYVVISHTNGDYTLYGNLDEIDSSIKVGTKVSRGQFIGTVDEKNETHPGLHFEIRVGGNDVAAAVDPLTIINPENPRPNIASGDHSTKFTILSKEEFATKVKSYCETNSCADTLKNYFIPNIEDIYDYSVSINVNPELIVVRAIMEGFSPGRAKNNYWGMKCYNTCPSCCETYSDLHDGIRGFASVATKHETVIDLMNAGYAYIGAYWYNPGSSGLGGCYYFPYIEKFMQPEDIITATQACNGASCASGGGSGCVKTNDSVQYAYATWQVEDKMNPTWRKMFGF